MDRLATQILMIKKSFVCTGIIQNGLLKKDELNYRLKVINEEDWDAEQDFLSEISNNGGSECVNEEIVE